MYYLSGLFQNKQKLKSPIQWHWKYCTPYLQAIIQNNSCTKTQFKKVIANSAINYHVTQSAYYMLNIE